MASPLFHLGATALVVVVLVSVSIQTSLRVCNGNISTAEFSANITSPSLEHLPSTALNVAAVAGSRNGGEGATMSIEEATSDQLRDVHDARRRQTRRFFIGIFSMLKDVERRELIRDTMLANQTHTCSYQDLREDCSFVFAFVIGAASPNATHTEWMSDLDGNVGDIWRPLQEVQKEYPGMVNDTVTKDLLFLNVKENMNNGKTPTWFEYASLHFEHAGEIDYVAKGDLDTLIDIKRLQHMLGETDIFPPSTQPVYGGNMHDFTACGGPSARKCHLIQRKVYMGGQLYWLSMELSKHVSDPTLRRSKEWSFTRNEDVDLAFKVFSYEQHPVHLMVLNGNQFWNHQHFMKKRSHYMRAFNEMVPGNTSINRWFEPKPP